MKIDRKNIFSLILTGCLLVPMLNAEGASTCLAELRAKSSPFRKNVGISTYRLLNAFPPSARQEVDLSSALLKIKGNVPVMSDACISRRILASAHKQSSSGLVLVEKEDFIPILIMRKGINYLVVYVHPGYIEEDGTGDELAADLVVYNNSGGVEDVVERIASWSNNEGTLLLRESCLSSNAMVTVEKYYYPEKVSAEGVVLGYGKAEEIFRSVHGLFGDVKGGYKEVECPTSSYVRAKGL